MKKRSEKNKGNPLWRLFSSVKLAVSLLITLAFTSIVGTLIPQGESFQFYLERYGATLFKVIRTLQIYDTYHSWWYIALLALFSVNLVVCTLKRLPYTLKLFKKDPVDVSPTYLSTMPFKNIWSKKDMPNLDAAFALFERKAGSVRSRSDEGCERISVHESGRWSYWGIYGLHCSILIIFAGAVFGSFTGFKGRIMLLEGDTTDHLMQNGSGESVPLGFSLKCENFDVSFYDTGAPKEFRSDLIIIENGKEVLEKSIVVNDPLVYKGVTFYQSSYQPVPEVTLKITGSNGSVVMLDVPKFERVPWEETGLLVGLSKYIPNAHGTEAASVWFASSAGMSEPVWVLKGSPRSFNYNGVTYRIALEDANERYFTGLQVKKDPGVWIVWIGCTAMVLGFAIVFWVAHRRLWLCSGVLDGEEVLILSGQTNKNRLVFERDFEKIKEAITALAGEKK